jgi:hypothetical protein
MDASLYEFFADGFSYTEYSYDSYTYSDTGSSSDRTQYIADLGITYSGTAACYWLGINYTPGYSAIGLMGDQNWGCASMYSCSLSESRCTHDDLALGVGLQSCSDSNGCSKGGSGHAAGMAYGNPTGTIYGPWFVYGR